MSIAICLVLVLSTVDSSPFFPVADLPRAVHWAASAAYNNSIFIMGGDPLPRQFIEYNILSDVMIDYGTHVMIDQGHPNEFGMYWSQYGNSLYVMDLVWNGHGEAFLDIYDLSSSLFPFNSSMITLQKGASNIIGVSACVVASEHFLFVAGGWEDGMLRILNVLSLPNHVWSLGPEMMIGRVNSGCAIMPDNYLYVLGGGTAENERILINDLQNQQWQPIESFDTTSNIFNYPGIAPYRDVIWVFGGRETQTGPDLDKIWNIYTNDVSSTGPSVSLLPESLPFVFSLVTGTMTIVQNVIYVFGDQSSIKYVISPTNPSNQPSETPTDNPSFNPTDIPSSIPSDQPSETPIDNPSFNPTDNPSFNPTDIPIPSTEPKDGSGNEIAEDESTLLTIFSILTILVMVVLGTIIALVYFIYCKRGQTEERMVQDELKQDSNERQQGDADGEHQNVKRTGVETREEIHDTNIQITTTEMTRKVNECTDCGQMEEVTEVNGLFYCAICREFIDDFDHEGDEMYNTQSQKATEGNTDGMECADNYDCNNQTITGGSD
eukprot:1154763_1